MIQISLIDWIELISLILLASYTGLAISSKLPWSNQAIQSRLDTAFGLAISPFLTGIYTVLSLKLLPGSDPTTHIIIVIGLLIISIITAKQFSSGSLKDEIDKQGILHKGQYFFILLLGLWVTLLLVNSVLLPLVQNDALEYAYAGRVLYLAGTLDAYPAVNPQSEITGFFGPWTHPPLYTTLIYLAYALQGSADTPGLMRLITPWFSICSFIGVLAISNLVSSRSKIVAAIFFISTPLFFLGADSAAIDALPVCGIVLILLALFGTDLKGFRHGLLTGVALGLSLWTHSQAILFIPLLVSLIFFQRGLRNWKLSLHESSIAIVTSIIIAFWPYIHNLEIYGAVISDNPAVFALKKLDWEGYFQFARGLDSTVALIQYGILKGWFSLRSYGFIFWVALIGIIFFFTKTNKEKILDLFLNGTNKTNSSSVAWLSIVLFSTYMAGVVLSAVIGVDLLVRNDRYILVMLPVITIISCYAFDKLGIPLKEVNTSKKGSLLSHTLILLLCIYLPLHLLLVGFHYRWNFTYKNENFIFDGFSNIKQFVMSTLPSMKPMKHLKSSTEDKAIVFTTRPANMFYSNRRMISHADPRAVETYKEDSLDKFADSLKQLNIDYIHITNYTLPTYNHSRLKDLLTDPSRSKLEYSNKNHQIYSLGNSGLQIGNTRDITPGIIPWTSINNIFLTNPSPFSTSKNFINSDTQNDRYSIFSRDRSTVYSTGSENFLGSGIGQNSLIKIQPDSEYNLSLKLKGKGYLRIYVQEFDKNRTPLWFGTRTSMVGVQAGDVILSHTYPEALFLRRLKTGSETVYIRIDIEHVGYESVNILNASLTELVPTKHN